LPVIDRFQNFFTAFCEKIVVKWLLNILPHLNRMRERKKFDNRSIFDKDMDKTLWLTFLGHPVYSFEVYCCTCIQAACSFTPQMPIQKLLYLHQQTVAD